VVLSEVVILNRNLDLFLRACLKRVEQATSLCLGSNLLPKSGGLVARQDGQVARSTPFQTGSKSVPPGIKSKRKIKSKK
jgi:hypothetical protein